MGFPQAYAPEQGYKYQILTKQTTDRAWEHCDYAVDRADKENLLSEYRLSYGSGFQFKTILLPKKYWPEVISCTQ